MRVIFFRRKPLVRGKALSQTYSQLGTKLSGFRRLLDPSQFSCLVRNRERERDAFGYCPDKKRLVENFVELETTTGNNFPGVIPNSVSSMPLHVINAILARVLLNYSTAQLYTTFPPLISYLPPASPIPRSTIHLDIDDSKNRGSFFFL